MSKTIKISLFMLLLVAMMMTGCGPASTPTAEAPAGEEPVAEEPTAEEVVMRIGNITGPDCLNHWACDGHWYYSDLDYDVFNGFGEMCSVEPRLAKSMELSDDGLTWTVHLQEGVTYNDGTPFNANVLVELWDWYDTTELMDWYPGPSHAVSWEAVDDYTFQFTTDIPVGTFPTGGGLFFYALQPDIWGDLTDDTVYDFEPKNVGTGPYTLEEFVPGETLVYEAREDYFLGKPVVDKLVFQVYNNWDAQIQALLAGEIDVSDTAIPPTYYDVLKADPNITVTESEIGDKYLLAFNVAPEGTKHPAVEDINVRKAIDYAVDKQQLLDGALLGHGTLCPTSYVCVPYGGITQDPNLEVTPQDFAMANQILDDAGYADTDGDGIRETPDGDPMTLRFFFDANSPVQITMAQMIVDWVKEIGIDFEAEALEEGTLNDVVRNQADFDVSISYTYDELDPQIGGDLGFSCWSAEFGSGMANDSHYCSEEFDAAIEEALGAITPEENQAMSEKMGQIINQDLPIINLVGESTIMAYRNDRFTFDGVGCTTNAGLWDWWTLTHNVHPK